MLRATGSLMGSNNSPREKSLTESAHRAIDDGHYDDARRLLKALVRTDPENFRAWLWLAGLSPSPAECINYIEIAESIKPNDPAVIKARIWADQRLAKANAARQPKTAAAALPTERKVVDKRKSRPKISSSGPPRIFSDIVIGVIVLGLIIAAGVAVIKLLDNPSSFLDQLSSSAMAAQPDVTRSALASSSMGSGGNPNQDIITAGSILPLATTLPNDGASPPKSDADNLSSLTPSTEINNLDQPTLIPSPTLAPLPTSTNTPEPTPTVEPTTDAENPDSDTTLSTTVLPGEKWIGVNIAEQKLVAYEGETPVFESLVSTGTTQFPTVTGDFRIWLRHESQDMNGYLLGYDYYLEGVPYVQYFYKDYAIHGTFWHNNFGSPMSHGCVNLSPSDAEWLFTWADYGTLVSIH
jgi:lipoprotein-anchoring transpeptidase ErfK/SrfK